MINYRTIFKSLGSLLFIESLLLAITLVVGIFYQEHDFMPFGIPMLVAVLVGMLFHWIGRNAGNHMSRRDGFLIVSSVWVLFSLVGMLPFLIGGHTHRVSVAFFEAMSGFTTTGASVFADIDALPHSILFWRALTHWLGGMGIVFFTVAILPAMAAGDQKIFSAESTGLKLGKLHPRIATTARWLWSFYFLLTGICIGCLAIAGMGGFDAVCHGLSTIATGGFSTHTDSIGWFHSSLIEYTEIVFMFLAGINFSLLYLLIMRGRWRVFVEDSELKSYVHTLLTAIVILAGFLFFFHDAPFFESIRKAFFNVISLMTTTGFTTDDFMQWHPITWVVLTFVGVCGACAGSTSGGIKVVRIVTAFKLMVAEFRRQLKPRTVQQVRLSGVGIGSHVERTVFAFFTAYIIIIGVSIMLMGCYDLPLVDCFGLAISSFSNIGPTIGREIGPLDAWGNLPDGILWLNSFLMLCGRLEIFSFLLPFIPSFWKEV